MSGVFKGPLSDDELREQIDAEILELQERIRVLRLKRNTLASIYRLSPEILAQIFLSVQDNILKTGFTDTHRYRQWMWLCQVSKHWRDVAVGFASLLWTRIQFTHKNWVQLCLERSKSAFLTVGLSVHSEDDLTIARMILRDIHRISDLDIFVRTELWEAFHHLLCQPAPNLERFSLFTVPLNRPRLPDGIFSNQTPQLRSISLNGCTYSLQSRIFSNVHLAKLALMQVSDQMHHIDSVIQLLRTLPELTSLTLIGAISPAVSTQMLSTHLPRLVTLEIGHADIQTNFHIMDFITFPPTARVLVQTFAYLPSTQLVQDFPKLLAAILRAYQGQFNPTKASYKLDMGMVTYSASSDAVELLLPESHQVKIEFSAQGDREIADTPGEMLIKTPDTALQSLKFVEIEAPYRIVVPGLWEKLSQIQDLREMALNDCGSSTSFVNYLIGHHKKMLMSEVDAVDDANPPVTSDVFPALRELGLYFLDLKEMDLRALYPMLATRKNNGIGLERIEIADEVEDLQEMKDELEERLMDLVDVVQWHVVE